MPENKFFTACFQDEIFKIPLYERSLFFSEDLKNLHSFFDDIKKSFNSKNNNYKHLIGGKIPEISLSQNPFANFKNNLFFLTYENNNEKTILEASDIISFLKEDFLNCFNSCQKCGGTLKKESLEDIAINISNKFNDIPIAIGTLTYHDEKINIKELIKRGIYYVIENKKILELDDIKNTNFKNCLLVDNKISSHNKEEIIKSLLKIKKSSNEFFIFTLNNNKLFTFTLDDCSICLHCGEKIKARNYISLQYIKNAFKDLNSIPDNLSLDNILIKDLLITKFSELFLKIKNNKLKNILKSFIDYGLGNYSFLSNIDDFNIRYVLNYLKIKNYLGKDDIICLQNPTSFLNDDMLKKIFYELKNFSTIIFENNQDILQREFKEIFYLGKYKTTDLIKNNLIKNINYKLPIKKNSINIIPSKFFEDCLFDSQKTETRTVVVSPIFQKNTFLANATNIFDTLRDVLLKTIDAKILGLTKKDFFIKPSNKYLCKTCLGKGYFINFLGLKESCLNCNGNFFNEKILNLRFKEKTFDEILNLSILEAIDFFDGFLKITTPLKFLSTLEINNLSLNYRCEDLPPNIINMLNISSKINVLNGDLIFIIKNALTFLSNTEKVRFINTLDIVLKGHTIILEAI